MPDHPAPPFDPELGIALESLAERVPPTITFAMIDRFRAIPPDPSVGGLVDALGIAHDRRLLPAFGGATIEASVFRPRASSQPGPGILYLHGGGMVFGNRFGGVGAYLPLAATHGAVIIAIDYRLAPEHPDPIPVEDCYAALGWAASQAADLNIDPGRLIVAGQSAGAGLAAGVALLVRTRGGPRIAGQVLVSPMLDDRNDTESARQIDGVGVWDRTSNATGWSALLGDRCGGPNVADHSAPGRAADLSGLPPTFLSVGSAEVFRDETVAFASRMWADGGVAELHVWPGGFHGFENFAPAARISTDAAASRDAWLLRTLER